MVVLGLIRIFFSRIVTGTPVRIIYHLSHSVFLHIHVNELFSVFHHKLNRRPDDPIILWQPSVQSHFKAKASGKTFKQQRKKVWHLGTIITQDHNKTSMWHWAVGDIWVFRFIFWKSSEIYHMLSFWQKKLILQHPSHKHAKFVHWSMLF